MYGNLAIISIALLVVVNVLSNRTSSVGATLTAAQEDMVAGVFKDQNWSQLWADLNETDSNDQRDPVAETVKKLQMIPRVVGCDFGVTFTWFLTLAACAIIECNRLWQSQDGHTGHCWHSLTEVIQNGSYTMSKVMGALEHIHFIVGDDIGSDELYGNMSTVQRFLTQRYVAECAAVVQDGRPSYFDELFNSTVSFQKSLISNCQKHYKPLNTHVLAGEQHQGESSTRKSYEFYVSKMNDYIATVPGRLAGVGFIYDPLTRQTTFKYPVTIE